MNSWDVRIFSALLASGYSSGLRLLGRGFTPNSID
jgi:hypothetical protein